MKNLRNNIGNWFADSLAILIVLFVTGLCTTFILLGTPADNGSITLDGKNAKISKSTEDFIENAEATLKRIMEENKPTDEDTAKAFDNDEVGLGFYTSIESILGRRLPDGDSDDGKGWQCSKYTAYLATGKRLYSNTHPDYGPVNGKDVASWLVKNYGFKYIDKPIKGAIGSGGFNTKYGHTAMYLYSTGDKTAMVNDANADPLKIATWNMNITGWVWVVPGNYNPAPAPAPTPKPSVGQDNDVRTNSYIVRQGDTLGEISLRLGWWPSANGLYGDNGYTQRLADFNNIKNRGLIYPNQQIRRLK